ncbi:MAG: acetate--CoA ligase family protein [Candidatus Magasanikbacteria bacterium]
MNLNSIFYPTSIAIIGASTKVGSVGNDIVKNLVQQGFKGRIYPVNPKADTLYDLECFPNINSINDSVELAVIVVPATAVIEVMKQVAQKGVKGVVIISAGFREAGNVEAEQEIKNICTKHDIALIGPNCLGVINAENSMNASFAMVMPQKGNVAFISQSGALCTAVLDYAQKVGIGFSKFVSAGNKAVVGEVELLEYLADDPETSVIAMYVEQLVDGNKIIETARHIIHGKNPKPIIVIKSGRTTDGASASASHTGALAGNDAAYEALFEQAGIIRAERISELFEYIRVFTHNPLPQGRHVAIITNAGGPGVLATDEAIASGLTLARLSDISTQTLKEQLPQCANIHNPIDLLGDAKADRYKKAFEILLADENVDSLAIILTPQSMTEIEETARMVIETQKKSVKPVVVSFVGGTMVSPAIKLMRENGVCIIGFPEQSIKALAALTQFAELKKRDYDGCFVFTDVDKKFVKKFFKDAKKQGRISFPEAEALKVLEAYKFPLLKSAVVKTREEAEKIAPSIGSLFAMKIVSEDILHKTEAGGVMLNVTLDQVGDKFDTMLSVVKKKMPEARLDGVLLVEMAPDSVEMIIGSTRDPGLGHVIMCGLGGIYVEVMKDVAFCLPPVSRQDVYRMLDKLKAKKMLDGARGGSSLDVEALVQCVGRLSQLLIDFPEIKEMDINPIAVLPKGQGVRVLDERIVIE